MWRWRLFAGTQDRSAPPIDQKMVATSVIGRGELKATRAADRPAFWNEKWHDEEDHPWQNLARAAGGNVRHALRQNYNLTGDLTALSTLKPAHRGGDMPEVKTCRR
jgi:hypothetical protein